MLLIITILLVLSSCMTGSEEAGPGWIRRPPQIFGSVVFIGHGYGESKAESRASAIEDALSSMSRGLGYDLVQYYLRELVSTDSIEELGTYINSEYTTESGNGFESYVALVTPETAYNSLRSEDYVKMLEREDQIRSRLSDAAAHYRANEDTEALADTIEALSLSLDGPVEDESLFPEALLEKAMEYLDNITIRADRHGNVTVRRTKGMFHPYVVSGSIDASYERLGVDGMNERQIVTCLTDQKGKFTFRVTDPYTVRGSDVIFSVSLPPAISDVRRKAPQDFLSEFDRLYTDKSVIFRYEEYTAFSQDEAVIGIAVYDMAGNIIPESGAYGAFSQEFRTAGASYTVTAAYGDDAESVYLDLLSRYPERSHIIFVRTGVTGVSRISSGWTARADSRIIIVDSRNIGNASERTATAVARGADEEEAMENALVHSAIIAAGMLLQDI